MPTYTFICKNFHKVEVFTSISRYEAYYSPRHPEPCEKCHQMGQRYNFMERVYDSTFGLVPCTEMSDK